MVRPRPKGARPEEARALRPNVGRVRGNPTAEDREEEPPFRGSEKKIVILNVIPVSSGMTFSYVAGDLAQAMSRGEELAERFRPSPFLRGQRFWRGDRIRAA